MFHINNSGTLKGSTFTSQKQNCVVITKKINFFLAFYFALRYYIQAVNETVPQPSGKAIDCNSVIISSNLIGTSINDGVVAEQADATDLKSVGRNPVWVQVPPSPPFFGRIARDICFQLFSCFFGQHSDQVYHICI